LVVLSRTSSLPEEINKKYFYKEVSKIVEKILIERMQLCIDNQGDSSNISLNKIYLISLS